MRLRSGLPERPSAVLLGPMLNLLLILVLVSFKSSALKPGANDEVTANFTLASGEQPFLVTVPSSIETTIYLDRTPLGSLDDLAEAIKAQRSEAESQNQVRNSVILEVDAAVARGLQESIQNRLIGLGFQVALLNEEAAP